MRKMIEGMGREPEGDEFEPLTWASWKGGQRAAGMDAMAEDWLGHRTIRYGEVAGTGKAKQRFENVRAG